MHLHAFFILASLLQLLLFLHSLLCLRMRCLSCLQQPSYFWSTGPYSSDPSTSHGPTIVTAATHVVNASVSTGTFPTTFKLAPLVKKPSLARTQVEDYRPVFLPFLSKTTERNVFKQVTEFLLQHNLLDSYQSGFRSGHSSENGASVCDRNPKRSRRGRSILSPHPAWLSAASDMVNHCVLLDKLRIIGIDAKAHSWFESLGHSMYHG